MVIQTPLTFTLIFKIVPPKCSSNFSVFDRFSVCYCWFVSFCVLQFLVSFYVNNCHISFSAVFILFWFSFVAFCLSLFLADFWCWFITFSLCTVSVYFCINWSYFVSSQFWVSAGRWHRCCHLCYTALLECTSRYGVCHQRTAPRNHLYVSTDHPAGVVMYSLIWKWKP